MKKYRITSIPQSLPKAQTGKSIEGKLKMKRQKYGSKQKDLDPNYGSTGFPVATEAFWADHYNKNRINTKTILLD